MRDPQSLKRWKVSQTLLRRAHDALPRLAENPKSSLLERTSFEYLENNEFGLALDVLEELGELALPRGGFWKDMIRAAENMELADRVPRFQKKFDQALLSLLERKLSQTDASFRY